MPPSYPTASPSHGRHLSNQKSSSPFQFERTVKVPSFSDRQKSKGPSSGKRKMSCTDEKEIMDHIKKKKEEFQMKVLKHRQKRYKHHIEFQEDEESMNNLEVSSLLPTVLDIRAKDNENSEVREADENARESAFLNVLKMYSNNCIQETIIIDDDEDGTVTENKPKFNEEKSHQNESSERNYNNANSEGVQKTGNVKKDEPKHIEQGVVLGKHCSSIDQLKNTNIIYKYNETIKEKNSGEVIDFLQSNKQELQDKSANIIKNITHQTLGSTNEKIENYKSSILEESASISYKSNLLEMELEKRNKEVVFTQQVDLASYCNEPKNSFDLTNNELENEFWIWSMKLKISQIMEQNNKNKYIASFQKQQSVENFQSSQSITSYYSNANIYQKPYKQDISWYKEYTPEKLLHNEAEITKTPINQQNTINHSNLAKNYTTNYANFLTRNDINNYESHKGLTTTKSIKQTSPVHDDSHKIKKNVFDKTSHQDKGKGHADSQSVNMLDIYMPTKMKEVTSDETDSLHSTKGREGMHLGAEQPITLHPECASENVVQVHTEIKYVNGDNLKSGSAKSYQNMDIIDVDLEPVNSPDVIIIDAEEWEADTKAEDDRRVLDLKMGEALMKTESKNMQTPDVCVDEARDTLKQCTKEGEYEQPKDKNSEVDQEIFYDDVFISNVKSTMYQYCLLA